MIIKKLIQSKEDWLKFVKEGFISHKLGDGDVWKKEDLPKLQAFFNVKSSSRSLTAEEHASFMHYQKCREDYADALFDLRDCLSGFHVEELVDYLGCYWDVPEETEDDYNIEELKVNEDFNQEFPAVVVIVINSDTDRLGDVRMFFMEFVEESMFTGR